MFIPFFSIFDLIDFDQMVFDVIYVKSKNLIFDLMVFDVINIRSYGVRSNSPSIKWSFDILVHLRLVTFDLVVGRLKAK
jgi:hypothetical protein